MSALTTHEWLGLGAALLLIVLLLGWSQLFPGLTDSAPEAQSWPSSDGQDQV